MAKLHADNARFWTEAIPFLKQLSQQNDLADVIDVSRADQPAYLIASPQLTKMILVKKQRYFHKSRGQEILRPLVGNGLTLSEGETHLQHRRLMQPAFSVHALQTYVDLTVKCINEETASWKAGDERAIWQDMLNLLMHIMIQTVFHASLTSQEVQSTRESMKKIDQYIDSIKQLDKDEAAIQEAVARLDQIMYRIIETRRQDPKIQGDLLATLLSAKEEGSNVSLTDQEVRDQVVTIFVGGQDTTSAAVTWVWYLLAKYPEIQAKVRTELEEVLGAEHPTFSDLKHLVYTTAVIKEALRLYPITAFFGRRAVEPVQIGDHAFQEEDMLILAPFLIQRRPVYFSNPKEFNPKRFIDAVNMEKYSYFPFGGGPRTCIGQHLAMMQIQLILATVLRKFRIEAAEMPEKPAVIQHLRPSWCCVRLVD